MAEIPLPPDEMDVCQATRKIVDILVPPEVARRDSKIRAAAERCAASVEIRDLVARCLPFRHENEEYASLVERLFIQSSQDMHRIRSLIYNDILSTCDFSELIGRTLTAGVEQCPFWDSYETAPVPVNGSIKASTK